MPATGAEEELFDNLGLECDSDAWLHYATKLNVETMLNFQNNLFQQYG